LITYTTRLMMKLEPFTEKDFDRFIEWVDNNELLITIAGSNFSFPLTVEQLLKYLNDEKSYSFNIVDTDTNKVVGHAELVNMGNDVYKIDKLLIGDKEQRGKGTGQKVMNELVRHAFEEFHANTVELNVFDWNTSAIRCYEKTGFTINPAKSATFKAGDKEWLALNMSISNLS
jgi:RimJ/RimL family protein N-acetyltransferase